MVWSFLLDVAAFLEIVLPILRQLLLLLGITVTAGAILIEVFKVNPETGKSTVQQVRETADTLLETTRETGKAVTQVARMDPSAWVIILALLAVFVLTHRR